MPIASASAPLITSPSSASPVRPIATNTTTAASSASADRRAGSRQIDERPSPIALSRIAVNGDTRRSASSGSSANNVATSTPTVSPDSTATGSRVGTTSTGIQPPISLGSAYCKPMPASAPASAPARPINAASIT
jgi:hypothetical protein